MLGSDQDRRQVGRTTLLAAAPPRRAGSLLDCPPAPEADDAAERHAMARAAGAERPEGLPEHAPGPVPEPMQASDPTPEAANPAGPDPADRAPPASRWSIPRIAGLTVAGALAGTLAAFAWPKTYVATAEMLIAPSEAALTAGGAPLSTDAALALVENQLRVLRSGTMLGAVADRLNLGADAEFNGAGGVLSGLGDLVAGDGGGPDQQRRRAVETLAGAVGVSREGSSSVVAVSAASGDPRKAALIANTIAELFVESAGRQPGNATARLDEMRAAVVDAESAVEAYRAENELIDAQGRPITDDEIARLGEQLSSAQARTVELNARAASAREADVDSIVTGSLPEQFSAPALADLRTHYAAARQQFDRLSTRLGPRHPERLAAEAEVEGARQQIAAELRRVASALQIELRRAVEQEQEFASRLARMKVRQGDIGDDMVRLRELERDAQLKRAAYERAAQAAQAASGAAAAASVISRAEPPLQAAGPSVAAFSLAGGLAGLLAGLGFGGWRRRDEPEDAAEADPAAARTEAAPNDPGKEAEAMYPYSPYGQQPAPEQAAPAQPSAYPSAHPYAGPQAHHGPAMPYAPPPPSGIDPWQMPAPPPAPMPQPAWGASYPAPMPPMPAPYDPWAQYRHPAPPHWPGQPYAAQPYAPPPPAVVYYVPVPQPAAAAPAVAEPAQASPRPAPRQRVFADRRADQDAFVDESTDAAIEEIRQSLREFREAIEDLADEHHRRVERRYGT